MKKIVVLFLHNGYNSLGLKTNNKRFGLQLHDAEVLAIN